MTATSSSDFLDERDSLADHARRIVSAIQKTKLEMIIFDCIINKTTSVLCRRVEEQKREKFLEQFIEKLDKTIEPERIVWSSNEVRRLYNPTFQLIRQHNGRINFHDALILLLAKESGLTLIASFDKDFDEVPWVRRVYDPESLQNCLRKR